jgi:hypothetical protein
MAMMFCNIGWMERYRGLKGQRDQISGGGSYVDENEHGSEVCNFLECRDGFTYGHVETRKGKIDRNIDIKPLGGGEARRRSCRWCGCHLDGNASKGWRAAGNWVLSQCDGLEAAR